MAFVACVIKQRPRNAVFSKSQGNAPQWSKWKCVINNKSKSSQSIKSTKGSASTPCNPGCIPQSN